jgi:hypothetical protein
MHAVSGIIGAGERGAGKKQQRTGNRQSVPPRGGSNARPKLKVAGYKWKNNARLRAY